MLQRGSRQRTLLAILKPSRPSPEIQAGGTCSWKSSGGSGGLKSTSELGVRVRFTAPPAAVRFRSRHLHRSFGQWSVLIRPSNPVRRSVINSNVSNVSHAYGVHARERSIDLKSHPGLRAETGGWIVADSAEGYRHKGYVITMAKKFAPGAELVIEG